jgi:VIT1/CCC1 family predicted Fe2+/Mn2+ transporter
VIWGLAVLGILSYGIAKSQKTSAWKMVAEHVGIALVVVVISHYVGEWISSTFG